MSGNVYLVGMPGSGKSAVGRALARRLSLPFVDLDEEVEASAGAAPAEIFAEGGEPRYRELEKAALSHISARNRAVVACGGGTVIDPDNRTIMRASGAVIWLRAPLEYLKRRDLVGPARPLLRTDADLERLWREREPIYREVADHAVDATETPDDVADAIVAVLP